MIWLRKVISAIAYPLILTVGIGVVWYILALVSGSEFIMPYPQTAIRQFFALLADSAFYAAFFFSLLRTLIAYAISLALALGFSLLSLFYAPVRRLLSPLVSVTRSLPTMAVVLLLVIWTGANVAPVVVALLVVFPTLYSSLYGAFTAVDGELIDVCRVCGGNNASVVTKVYLPLGVPIAAPSVSGGLSLTLKLMIAAEVLARTAGSLGAMMQISQIYFETATLMALTVVTVITSIILEKLLLFALTRIWR